MSSRPASDLLNTAALARVYNGAVGGAMNSATDRKLLAQVLELVPGYAHFAAANRTFVRAAIHRVLSEGITQIVDLGAGMFADGSTYEIAQHENPAVRVVYVDTDPVVIANLEQIANHNELVGIVHADMCDVEAVLNGSAARVLDMTKPVGLLAAAVLHCVPDNAPTDPVETVLERYHDAFAPGSMLALSHASGDCLPPDILAQAVDLFRQAGITIVSRTRQKINGLLRPWQPEPAGMKELTWQVGPGETVYAHGYTVIAHSTLGEVGM